MMNKNNFSPDHPLGNCLVLKFGGASLATPEHFLQIAKIIKNRLEKYSSIIVIVSAMKGVTNQLLSLTQKVHPDPPKREVDMLITTGERVSCALLCMALDRLEIPSLSLTGSQAGIITCYCHTNAQIVKINTHRLIDEASRRSVLVIAGFQGVSLKKEITTLGRGGSDTSAVALAVALGAKKVEFFKDVAGIFDCDPNENEQATLISHMDYIQAINIVEKGAKILHKRSLELAQKNKIPLQILSFYDPLCHQSEGTLISEPPLFSESTPSLFEECPHTDCKNCSST